MTDFKSDLDIARYTLLIEGLPRKLPVKDLQELMTQNFEIVFPANNTGHSPFVKVRVIGDYDKLYSLCIQLKELTS
jgi:hypothetical protein